MIDNLSSPVLVGLGGGGLIVLAATLFLFLNGRIAGISNIIAGLWTRNITELSWRVLFIAGLISGGTLIWHGHPEWIGTPPADRSLGLIACSGFLAGFGACLGNGCTSGHGVCGLGRRSLRSLAATLTFMTTGIITVAVIRHFGN